MANALVSLQAQPIAGAERFEAVNQFREVSRLKQQSAEAHNNLGAALVNVGRANDAVAEFEMAIRLAPQWNEPRANLARLR